MSASNLRTDIFQQLIENAKEENRIIENKCIQEEERLQQQFPPSLLEIESTFNQLFTQTRQIELNQSKFNFTHSNVLQEYLKTEKSLTSNLSFQDPMQEMLRLQQVIVQAITDKHVAHASVVHALVVEQQQQQQINSNSKKPDQDTGRNTNTNSNSASSVQDLEKERSLLMTQVQELTATLTSRLTEMVSSTTNIENNCINQDKDVIQFIQEVASIKKQVAIVHRAEKDQHHLLFEQNKRLSLVEYEMSRENERLQRLVQTPLKNLKAWEMKGLQNQNIKSKSTKTKNEEKKHSFQKKKRKGRKTTIPKACEPIVSTFDQIQIWKEAGLKEDLRVQELLISLRKKSSYLQNEQNKLLTQGLGEKEQEEEVKEQEIYTTNEDNVLMMRAFITRKMELEEEVENLVRLKPNYGRARKINNATTEKLTTSLTTSKKKITSKSSITKKTSTKKTLKTKKTRLRGKVNP